MKNGKQLLGLMLLSGALLIGCSQQVEPVQEEQPQVVQEEQPQVVEEEKPVIEEEQEKPVVEEKQEPQLTLGQKNAIKTAESYLSFTAFSREGLIRQLEFEGYTTEEATFAVDNVTVNWNEQCARVARSYLEFTSFSRQGLHDQLEYEGFTEEQIQYGLQAVGY